MPKGLRRIQGGGDWHFITCSCYRRLAFLRTARRRDLFLKILEDVRHKYELVILGYVVMPEHFHLLVSEPKSVPFYTAMQVLKQRVSLRCRRTKRKSSRQMKLWKDIQAPTFWQPRYYDFNVYSGKKKKEKLDYMHRNPVKRGLVELPEQWRWSSYRFYHLGEKGPVKIVEKGDSLN